VPAWRTVGLLAAPVAIDGLTQVTGLRESTTTLRVITGAFLGAGICWLLFPYLEIGFAEMRDKLESRFGRLAAEGRARPL
jgi:uncharacterized membrane protein